MLNSFGEPSVFALRCSQEVDEAAVVLGSSPLAQEMMSRRPDGAEPWVLLAEKCYWQ